MVEVVRMHCLTLPLVLKREWYDLIDSGFKRVEFRRADYWLPRASKWAAKARSGNLLPVIEFRHGYRSDARRMAFACGCYWYPERGFVCSAEPFTFRPKDAPVYHRDLGETAIDRVVFFLGERVSLMECKC